MFEKRFDDAAYYLRRAIRSGEDMIRKMQEAGPINFLAEIRRSLAGCLSRLGHSDESEALLVANRQMLERLGAESQDPLMAARRVIARLDLSDPQLGSLPAAYSAPSDDQSRPGRAHALDGLASPEGNPLLPEVWAELAARALVPMNGLGTTAAWGATAGYELSSLLSETASALRRSGKLGEARRLTDRILAFGRHMVARYPNQSAAHLALSGAYRQRAKDSWEIRDRAAVERNLELSLGSAVQAVTLDPGSEFARYQVDRIVERLEDLRHPK